MVDRIALLSEALFAIALTLTVLEVRIPGRQTQTGAGGEYERPCHHF
jgi:uncharacterized membrane protein